MTFIANFIAYAIAWASELIDEFPSVVLNGKYIPFCPFIPKYVFSDAQTTQTPTIVLYTPFGVDVDIVDSVDDVDGVSASMDDVDDVDDVSAAMDDVTVSVGPVMI